MLSSSFALLLEEWKNTPSHREKWKKEKEKSGGELEEVGRITGLPAGVPALADDEEGAEHPVVVIVMEEAEEAEAEDVPHGGGPQIDGVAGEEALMGSTSG